MTDIDFKNMPMFCSHCGRRASFGCGHDTGLVGPNGDSPDKYGDNTVRVRWVSLDEGINGEWDPNDPDDKRMLRFDVEVHRSIADEWDYQHPREPDWFMRNDGSYCTRVPVDTPYDRRYELLQEIHAHIGNPPTRRRMEEASWITPEGMPSG